MKTARRKLHTRKGKKLHTTLKGGGGLGFFDSERTKNKKILESMCKKFKNITKKIGNYKKDIEVIQTKINDLESETNKYKTAIQNSKNPFYKIEINENTNECRVVENPFGSFSSDASKKTRVSPSKGLVEKPFGSFSSDASKKTRVSPGKGVVSGRTTSGNFGF